MSVHAYIHVHSAGMDMFTVYVNAEQFCMDGRLRKYRITSQDALHIMLHCKKCVSSIGNFHLSLH